MALVQVRAKKTEANPSPSEEVLVVDEGWLDRWPDDFERVKEQAPAAPVASADGEQEPRRRSGGF